MGYKKSEASIAGIVEGAIRVLARQGYAHTSLMDIAKEVGMSKGAVHYHFPSKEALIGEVVRVACDRVAERTRAAWTEGEGDPAHAIRNSLRYLWRVRSEMSDDARVVADLMTQALHDETLRPPLAGYYRLAFSQVDDHLTANLDRLGLRPKIPAEQIPRLLHALLDGLLMQKTVDPESIHEDEVIQALESLALALFELRPPVDGGVGGAGGPGHDG